MGVVWYRLRADVRVRWRTLALIAVLVGIGAGVALTAFAGARRTSAAIPQMLAYSRPDDGQVVVGGLSCPPLPVTGPAARSLAPLPAAARVLRLPQVAAYMRMSYLSFSSSRSGFGVASVNVTASADAQGFRAIDRPLMVAGRFPDPRHPFDAAISDTAARRLHLSVGSRLTLYAYSQAQACGLATAGRLPAPAGPRFTVRVVGIARLPSDVNAIAPLAAAQNVDYEGQGNLFLTPAFLGRYAAAVGIAVQDVSGMNSYYVRLHGGLAGWNAFAAGVSRLDRSALLGGGSGGGGGAGLQVAAASAERGTQLAVVALLLFGALAWLVTVLLAGQALARQVLLDEADLVILTGLGMSRAQIVAAAVLRAALAGVAGGVLAVAGAVAASPLMPVGLARQAEISPGISADALVLAAGFLAIVLVIAALGALPAWGVSRRGPGRGEAARRAGGPRLAGLLARSPLPLTTVLGVRFGLTRGRDRTAVPVGTALAGAATAVLAVAAALTFGASVDQLVNSPRQQGWNWDVLVGNPNAQTDPAGQIVPRLAADPLAGSYSAVTDLQGGATVDGTAVGTTFVFDPLKGAVFPPLLEGRPPRTPGEIVLGGSTLRQIGRQVGQTVRLGTPAGTTTMRVVGRMIVPSVGDVLTNGLGQGAWVSASYFRWLLAKAARLHLGNPPPPFYQLFAVRYAPGARPAEAFARLQHDFGPTVLRQLPAESVVNLQSVDGLPLVLAGLAAVLGAAAVGSTMTIFVRRRRRDLAILKTLGFRRRQVAATVAWQAASFMLVALALGLPLGVAAGRWAWDLAATQLQSAAPPAVPVLAIALVVPAALLAGNALAAGPARTAARTAPAISLRQE